MKDAIAKLDLVCVHPTGERFPVCVEIGRPYHVRDGKGADCAACPVSMRGLHKRLHDIHGDDTFQALTLTLAFVRKLLGQFVENGGRVLFSEDGKTEFNFSVYFPSDKA